MKEIAKELNKELCNHAFALFHLVLFTYLTQPKAQIELMSWRCPEQIAALHKQRIARYFCPLVQHMATSSNP